MNRHNEHRIFQISQSQRNIWAIEQVLPDTPMNNICTSIRIKGQMDVVLAEKCINLVLEKDLSLRTRIAVVNGNAYQYHTEYKQERFPFYNFSLSDEEGFLRFEKTIAEVPMPIYDSPLYRFYIYRSDEKSGGILIKIHHLIADGFSIVQLISRIFAAYSMLLDQDGREKEVPQMPSYQLHVDSENKYLMSDAFDKDSVFWREKLTEYTGERAGLKNSGGLNISNIGDRCSFVFPQHINHAIEVFCKKNRVNPLSVYYAALAIYLNKMSGHKHICIGVPIVNRPDFTDKQTGGMYVNTLPFFYTLFTEKTAEEIIFSMTEEWYDLLKHQRFPFSDILALDKQLRKNSDEGGRNLFDIVLSYQDSKVFSASGTSMLFSGKWIYSGYQNEQLVIHLSSLDGENRFAVDYDYLIQFYSKEEITALHRHIIKILGEILLYPSVPIKQLNLLHEDELEKVLYTFNDTGLGLPPSTLAIEFIKAAEYNPYKTALIYDDKKMTYNELYMRALTLSKYFQHNIAAKKPKENIIALCLPRSFDLVSSMLAVSFSANAWVILPPQLPSGRMAHIVSDSGAELIVTLSCYSQYFKSQSVPVIYLDRLSLADFNSTDSIVFRSESTDLAYVVYTSGSTGLPKGVMIEHQSLINFSFAMDDVYANGGVLSICSTGFDVFILETISALICRRTVILTPDEYANTPSYLAELIKNYAANTLAITPSRLSAYILNPQFAAALSSVESIICGGESLTGSLIGKLERLTKARIYNQYGPSETTIGVSYKCISGSGSLSAGKPMMGCRLYVLDENLSPLPIGATGNLYIAGSCVGRGYIGGADNDKFFTEDIFSSGRMYKSGDLARWDNSGEISIIGRSDSQVKFNGLRIEPQEIAAALNSYPKISQTAVKIVQSDGGGQITAYYVAEEEIDSDTLYSFLESVLPPSIIPHYFVRVSAIKLTANGKTDFDALPAVLPVQRQLSQALSQSARQITGVFRSVLKNDSVTADSMFFKSGGDSLNALAAVMAISNLVDYDVSPADLRRFSPRQLAEKIDRLKDGGDEYVSRQQPQPKITPVFSNTYPLTPIQKTVLFSSFADPSKIAYNMPGGFYIDNLDKVRLEEALLRLIQNEEIFRTAFVFKGADAVAVIRDTADFRLEEIFASSYEEALKKFVRPFDLSAPPLLRAGVWENNGKVALLVDIHHIINDGEGTPIILNKLDMLYRGEFTAEKTVSYKDYAHYLAAEHPQSSTYWENRLKGAAAPIRLPENTDYDSLKNDPYNFEISAADIDNFCKKQNITAYTLFVAGLGKMLSDISGQNDLIIGTPIAGRNLPQTLDMAGAFINTLPLRITIDNGSAADYIQKINSDIADMLENTLVTQEELITISGLDRSGGHKGLYNVMFSMRPDYQFYFNGQKVTMLPEAPSPSKMDLILEGYKTEDIYRFSLSGAYKCEALKEYAARFTLFLKQLLHHNKEDISVLPPDKALPQTVLVDKLADDYAKSNPAADAIVFKDKCLSYNDFMLRSNSIAAQLQRFGIKRGDVVGVYCGRTPMLLCGIFAILKCGAAYLPLSSSLPDARISKMLKLSGAAAVMTDDLDFNRQIDCPICVITQETLSFSPIENRKESDTAQVLFTSGSTGEPKGVMISHRSLCGLIDNLKQMYKQDGVSGGMLCSSSILFDSFTLETIAPLALGVSVVLADQEEMTASFKLASLLKAHNAQAMFATPSKLKVFLEDDSFVRELSSLKMVQVGGESMSAPLALRLSEICKGSVYNLYGPAEATVFVTSWKVNGNERVTIGYPVAGAKVYVLDKNLQPVQGECEGEIYIGGQCLSKGYAGRDDLTAAVFIDSPFSMGEKLYRSGDMARLLKDGRIEYLGRRDNQIKLNGQRIELEEISGAIINAGASDAAVIPVNNADNVMLKAFVVMPTGQEFDERQMRESLSKALPSYMLPAQILKVEAIPLTENGKIDTNALLSIRAESLIDSAEKTEEALQKANQSVQEVLIDMWKEVLSADSIDENRSFFEQGGTSLACMNMLVRYFKKGWEMTLTVFYENPTINKQAEYILNTFNQKQGDDILVTGATGFLGAHIIYELISQKNADIYCLVRDGKERLYDILEYYFTKHWVEANRDRIIPVVGDINLDGLAKVQGEADNLAKKIGTVYHCAADVRHYMSQDDAYKTNLEGTKNVIAFCEKTLIKLIFFSTLSVSGEKILRENEHRYVGIKEIIFDEECFDIGQNWRDNVYVRSKFLAELEVNAAVKRGMNAKIFRIGRLVGRQSDGKFQKNKGSNYFYNVITGLAAMPVMPSEIGGVPVEITPIDSCARAAVILSDSDLSVAHISDPNLVSIEKIIKKLTSRDIIKVGLKEYKEILLNRDSEESGITTMQRASLLNSSLALAVEGNIRVTVSSKQTDRYLKEAGFEYPPIDIEVALKDFKIQEVMG